jgi:hypothetical protein
MALLITGEIIFLIHKVSFSTPLQKAAQGCKWTTDIAQPEK